LGGYTSVLRVGLLTFSFQVFIPFTELALKVKQTPTRKTDVRGTQTREVSLGQS